MLIPCRCSSVSSCTSRPLSKFRNLLHVEWVPVYHARGGEFSTGTLGIFTPALTRDAVDCCGRVYCSVVGVGSGVPGAVGLIGFGRGTPGGATGVPGGATGVGPTGTPGICPRFPPSSGFQMNSHSK